jgi:excisionase family DNA binding protein
MIPLTRKAAGGGLRMGSKMERLTLTVPEAARLLGVSRMSAYSAVRDGTIPSLRIGRRVLVPRAGLERLLEDAARHPATHG